VKVIQVDVVSAQALQRGLARLPDMLSAAVKGQASLRFNDAAFRCNDVLAAVTLDCLAWISRYGR
jgi:hypothetical protein